MYALDGNMLLLNLAQGFPEVTDSPILQIHQ